MTYGFRKASAPRPGVKYMGTGSSIFPSSFDLRAVLAMADVRDQASSEGCVGQGLADACHVGAGCVGAYPSPLAVYTMARTKERSRIGAPLTDVGCDPFDAVSALLQWGIVPESDWPLDLSQVDAELPWDVLQDAVRLQPSDLSLIVGKGNERINDIKASILAHAAVTLAMPVDQRFEDWSDGKTYPGLAGPVLGGHYVVAIGWRSDAILIRNSWGTGWGDGGHAWLANAFVGSTVCSDFVSVSHAPVLGGS